METDMLTDLENYSLQVGFIGAGNMAQAIIGCILSKGLARPEQMLVSAPSDTHLRPLRTRGLLTTHRNQDVVDRCDVVFHCVKPYVFVPVASSLSLLNVVPRRVLHISIVAGLSIDFLFEHLGLPWIRAMPNTPCLVGEGCCVYTLGQGVPERAAKVGGRLLSCLGLVRRVSEEQINAVTALSGSGPAYIYAAIEALADGGVRMGLPRELSLALAAQTVKGAAAMVQETGRHPGQLKDEVCSPGGTTIAALHSLERDGFRAALMNAVEAAATRAKEIGQEQERNKTASSSISTHSDSSR